MDENLKFDLERFIGACSLVSTIEEENGYKQELSVPKRGKRAGSHQTREGNTNIGGLGEGTLHLVLKNYISANPNDQEKKIGRKITDVYIDGKAYEIQTRNFGSLKEKLADFLPKMPVTVVFPVILKKRIAWIDPETGEMGKYHASPKKETLYNIFYEMVYIKDYLKEKNLSFCIFELAADETKLLSGRSYDRKKYGAVRLNRVPTQLYNTYYFEDMSSFLRLLPKEDEVTVKSIASHAGIECELAQKMIYCLVKAGVLSYDRNEGKEKIYKILS